MMNISNISTKKSVQNTKKTIGKTSFCNTGNPDRGNLINTVVYEDFWEQFTEKWLKTIKKALGFALNSHVITRHRQSWLFPTENCNPGIGKMNARNPYKHCRLRRLLESNDQKMTKTHQKALGFHSNLMWFRYISKSNFSNGKTAICDIENCCSENLINTGVY